MTDIVPGPKPPTATKPGWKTTEFWLVIVIIAPAITAMVEALQKGETGTAALLAGINAAVGGAYAIARGMAKSHPGDQQGKGPENGQSA